MAAKKRWSEMGVEEYPFEPFIDSTNTLDKWKEWARNQNVLVKVKTDSTHARNNGEIQIERCTAAGDVPIGILRSITGNEVTFPKKPSAQVAVRALDCNVTGSGTGELADDDFGKAIASDSEGHATIVNSGGVARVVGGTKEELRIAFDFINNFR